MGGRGWEFHVESEIHFILAWWTTYDLGNGFPTKHHAILDCFNKEVALREPRKFEIKFLGDKKVELASIISVLKTRKLIKKEHTAYLARVVNTQAIKNDPRSVSIVYVLGCVSRGSECITTKNRNRVYDRSCAWNNTKCLNSLSPGTKWVKGVKELSRPVPLYLTQLK